MFFWVHSDKQHSIHLQGKNERAPQGDTCYRDETVERAERSRYQVQGEDELHD